MFLPLLIWAGSAAASTLPTLIEPKIVRDEGVFYLDVGRQVQNAVKKFDPYFEAWTDTDFIPSVRQEYKSSGHQTLAGIVSDFNGDGRRDVALLGRTRDNNVLLAVVSQGQDYRVFVVDRGPLINPRRAWIEGPAGREPGLWTYLSYVKAGWLSSRVDQRPSLQLKSDGFAEHYFGKGSVVYFFKDGKFERYTQGE